MNNIGLNGRLGNQMFQYAALMGIAKKNDFEYGINFSNDYGLDLKDIPEDIYINQKILTLSRLFKLSAQDSADKNYRTISEPYMHFCEDLFNITDNVNLHGYFQTEKYFEHIKEEVRNEYRFPEHLISSAKEFTKTMQGFELVSVHFRKSDYLNLKHFYNTDLDAYYEEAFKIFDSKKYKFLLFSDDIDFLYCNFSNKERFHICDAKNQFLELATMTICDHNIIANSSFSWWGAWLNPNINKKIIAPKRWFNEGYGDKDTKDIYCPGWIKL
jgi:hypothetical protein